MSPVARFELAMETCCLELTENPQSLPLPPRAGIKDEVIVSFCYLGVNLYYSNRNEARTLTVACMFFLVLCSCFNSWRPT